jgi:hypothetical protein
MQSWLTTSVPGIIILGAAGSLGAIAATIFVRKVLPYPFKLAAKHGSRDGYIHCFVQPHIEADETGKMLVSKLVYHLSHLIIYLCSFLFLGVTSLVTLITRSGSDSNGVIIVLFAGCAPLFYFMIVEYAHIRDIYRDIWQTIFMEAKVSWKEHSRSKPRNQSPADS